MEKIYVVTEEFDNDGSIDSCVLAAFHDKGKAVEYMRNAAEINASECDQLNSDNYDSIEKESDDEHVYISNTCDDYYELVKVVEVELK